MRSNQANSYKVIERPIYGSSRVGIDNTQLELIGYTAPTGDMHAYVLGNKQYEFSNHLGNVLTTVTDKKIPVDVGNDGTIDWYVADITSATDYYPFGSPMDGRTFSSDKYRFGFNGQEKDDEVAGAGNSNTAMFWEYDTRLGRRWNLDPKPTVGISDYACFRNSPLVLVDILGDKAEFLDDDAKKGFNDTYKAVTSKIAELDGELDRNIKKWEKRGYSEEKMKKKVDKLKSKLDYNKWLST